MLRRPPTILGALHAVLAAALALTLAALRDQQRTAPSAGGPPVVPNTDDIVAELAPVEDASPEGMRRGLVGTWVDDDPKHDGWTFEFIRDLDGDGLKCRTAPKAYMEDSATEVIVLTPKESPHDGLLRFEAAGRAPKVDARDPPPHAEYRFWLNREGVLHGDIAWEDHDGAIVLKSFGARRAESDIEELRAALLGRWREGDPQFDGLPDSWVFDIRAAEGMSLRCKIHTKGWDGPEPEEFTDAIVLEPIRDEQKEPPVRYRGFGGAAWIHGAAEQAEYIFFVRGDQLAGDIHWHHDVTYSGKTVGAVRLPS